MLANDPDILQRLEALRFTVGVRHPPPDGPPTRGRSDYYIDLLDKVLRAKPIRTVPTRVDDSTGLAVLAYDALRRELDLERTAAPPPAPTPAATAPAAPLHALDAESKLEAAAARLGEAGFSLAHGCGFFRAVRAGGGAADNRTEILVVHERRDHVLRDLRWRVRRWRAGRGQGACPALEPRRGRCGAMSGRGRRAARRRQGRVLAAPLVRLPLRVHGRPARASHPFGEEHRLCTAARRAAARSRVLKHGDVGGAEAHGTGFTRDVSAFYCRDGDFRSPACTLLANAHGTRRSPCGPCRLAQKRLREAYESHVRIVDSVTGSAAAATATAAAAPDLGPTDVAVAAGAAAVDAAAARAGVLPRRISSDTAAKMSAPSSLSRSRVSTVVVSCSMRAVREERHGPGRQSASSMYCRRRDSCDGSWSWIVSRALTSLCTSQGCQFHLASARAAAPRAPTRTLYITHQPPRPEPAR